ncbi:transporter [Methylobacter sp.]|uniref:transporter n=1 Tax=Methylobacter sp. TaxID=2051955 RepID=UPI002600DE31|nr:transporter [Methylobacter sp.]
MSLPLIAQAEQLTVTPYRPTVSNPAELSALQHLEVEFGVQSNQPGMEEERNSLPFLLKYPFADQWGLLVGGEAWIKSRSPDETISGFGNTSVLLKHYYPINSTLAVGFEAGAVLPSARKSLGQGRTDYLGNLIVSQDISDLRIDVNAGVTRKGFKEEDLDRYRYNWAIAVSHPIDERWGIAGEFSGVLARQQKPTSQFLATLNYLMTPELMLDFGGTIGMTTITDDYGVFAGFALLIAP